MAATIVDLIVQVLGSDVPRDLVQLALTQQNRVVTDFEAPLDKRGVGEAPQAKILAKDSITITDTQCKP